VFNKTLTVCCLRMAEPRAYKYAFAKVVWSFFDQSATDEILFQAVRDAALLPILETAPLQRIDLLDELQGSKIMGRNYGLYAPNGQRNPNRECPRIYLRRPERMDRLPNGNETLKPGESPLVSVMNDTTAFTKCIFIHELGHHLFEHFSEAVRPVVKKAFPSATPISQYAALEPEEYFCESLAAFVYHNKSLKKHDPVGYNLVRKVMQTLQKEVK
jgi:hypothetical protein